MATEVRLQDAESGDQACVGRGQGAAPYVPPEQVARWATKLEELNDEVAAILEEEKEEMAIRQALMELKKGENIIEHEKEMFSRPARTWFQSE